MLVWPRDPFKISCQTIFLNTFALQNQTISNTLPPSTLSGSEIDQGSYKREQPAWPPHGPSSPRSNVVFARGGHAETMETMLQIDAMPHPPRLETARQ